MVQSNEDPVKRQYRSPARADAARATRRVVVEAAGALMAEHGYGSVTVDMIASAAGVARRTVFTSVGGKLEALKLLLDWATTGDDEDLPLQQREVIMQIAAMTDPDQALHAWAELTAAISGRLAVPARILAGAAAIDAEARDLRGRAREQRLSGQRAFARHLRKLRALRPGLTLGEAADVLWLLSDPALYDSLVHERGWSPRRFEAWLASTAQAQLRP